MVVALSVTTKVFAGEFSNISDAYCCFSNWIAEFPAGGMAVVGHVAKQGKTNNLNSLSAETLGLFGNYCTSC